MDNAIDAAKPRPEKKPSGEPKLIRQRPRQPVLRLTPYAWAKLLTLRDAGPTEIGGFGISAKGLPLLVEDIRLVKQHCDWASVALDDDAVAHFFDEQVDVGRSPEDFGRIWLHTHPGTSAEPSLIDEETFARVFGACDWAVMFILAAGGSCYARLQFGVGPGGSLEIPVEVAYHEEFKASDRDSWAAEYAALVLPTMAPPAASPLAPLGDFEGRWDPRDVFGLSRFPTAEEARYDEPW